MKAEILKIVLFLLSILFFSYVVPMKKSNPTSLPEALMEKEYLFDGNIYDYNMNLETKSWAFKVNGKQYFIKKGRPDKICSCWDGFVAKLSVQQSDFTIFTQGDIDRSDQYSFTEKQKKLIKAVEVGDCKTVSLLLDKRDTVEFRTRGVINYILAALWCCKYPVKAAASLVLALLCKDEVQEKLDLYVYRVWAHAAEELNYVYFKEPTYSKNYKSIFKQLGVSEVSCKKRVLVFATCLPGKTSYAIMHKVISEDFFIISGTGQFWIKEEDREIGPFEVRSGDYVHVPKSVHIQFKNESRVQPLHMFVLMQPPWDQFSDTDEKEVSVVVGHWKKRMVENLKMEYHLQIRRLFLEKGLADPNGRYLKRLFIAKYHPEDFIDTKLKIIKNEKENWGLRAAVIESLKGNRDFHVEECLRSLDRKATGFIKKAITSVL